MGEERRGTHGEALGKLQFSPAFLVCLNPLWPAVTTLWPRQARRPRPPSWPCCGCLSLDMGVSVPHRARMLGREEALDHLGVQGL